MPACKVCGHWFVKVKPHEELCEKCECALCRLSGYVAPVVHGRWIERRAPHAMGGISAECSVCSKSVQYLGNPLNYCPNYGAKMDGGNQNV